MLQSEHRDDGLGKRYIDLPEVLRKIPVTRQTIENWERAGAFPKRIRIGGRVFWLLSEVDDWIDREADKRWLDQTQAAE